MSLFGEPFSKKSIRSQLGHCLAYPLRTRRAFSLNFDLHFEPLTWKVSFVLIDWPGSRRGFLSRVRPECC